MENLQKNQYSCNFESTSEISETNSFDIKDLRNSLPNTQHTNSLYTLNNDDFSFYEDALSESDIDECSVEESWDAICFRGNDYYSISDDEGESSQAFQNLKDACSDSNIEAARIRIMNAACHVLEAEQRVTGHSIDDQEEEEEKEVAFIYSRESNPIPLSNIFSSWFKFAFHMD